MEFSTCSVYNLYHEKCNKFYLWYLGLEIKMIDKTTHLGIICMCM